VAPQGLAGPTSSRGRADFRPLSTPKPQETAHWLSYGGLQNTVRCLPANWTAGDQGGPAPACGPVGSIRKRGVTQPFFEDGRPLQWWNWPQFARAGPRGPADALLPVSSLAEGRPRNAKASWRSPARAAKGVDSATSCSVSYVAFFLRGGIRSFRRCCNFSPSVTAAGFAAVRRTHEQQCYSRGAPGAPNRRRSPQFGFQESVGPDRCEAGRPAQERPRRAEMGAGRPAPRRGADE